MLLMQSQIDKNHFATSGVFINRESNSSASVEHLADV